MKIYAVIDTNVIVSAFLSKKSDAATVIVLNAVMRGSIIPLYNQEILEEYEEVLNRKKFRLNRDTVSVFISIIRQFGLAVKESPTGMLLPDADDLVFYEVAMEKRDEGAYLVTGNIKHFPKKAFIVTPAEMAEILRNNNADL